MLEIEYKGANAVVLATKERKLAIDPNVELYGLKNPKKTEIQIATEKRFLVEGDDETVTLEGPGEYEAGPFTIRGIAARRHIDTEAERKLATVYRVEVGEYRIGVIGNIAPELTDDQAETIGVVDILILPVGGNGYTLDAKSAAKIIGQVEPKVVIPVHYQEPGVLYEVPQEALEVFTKELGAPVENIEKLKYKTAASLPASLTVVQIQRS